MSLSEPSRLGNLKFLPRDPLSHPKVKLLKKSTHVEALIRPLKTEHEQALAIARFVSEAWEHDGFQSHPLHMDALYLLREARKGASFSCVQYASVFVQLCQSVGIPARVIAANTKRVEWGSSGHGHVTGEYFDNQYGKWIWVDPQIHATAWAGLRPLSFTEYSERVFQRKPVRIQFSQRTVDYLKGRRSGLSLLRNFIKRYIWGVRVGGLAAFYTPQDPAALTACCRRGMLPALTFQGFANRTAEILPADEFDAPLNSCRLRFETFAPKKPVHWKDIEDYKVRHHLGFARSKMRIYLTHNAPWFSHYEIQFNGKKRRLRADELDLQLKPGKNTLKVCAVNEVGRKGPVSQAVIAYDSRYPQVVNYW